MSFLSSIPFVKSKNPKQVSSLLWEERETILREDVNLFCWLRSANQDIVDYLESCIHAEVEPISISTNKADLPSKLSRSRYLWDSDHIEKADKFWVDVYQLVNDFLALSQQDSCRIYLRIVDNNACSKFHIDGFALRLFTTYLGPGTEWLPEAATNRNGLGKSNDLIVRDYNEIQKMDAFDVAILKGEARNGNNSTKGIVHRSPAIVDSGQKRIVLRVDI